MCDLLCALARREEALLKTVIMAGGQGRRIREIRPDIPKPMLPLEGSPVLEHTIEVLRRQGLTDILITVSHLRRRIMEYFGDGSGVSPATGRPFGVHIRYYEEELPLGSGGALLRLEDQLREDFLLLNGDLVFDVDISRFIAAHKGNQDKGGLATLFTHPNDHPFDSAILAAGEDGAVERWITKEEPKPYGYQNRVNAGLHILSPNLFGELRERGADLTGRVDLDRQLLRPLAGTGRLYCYQSPEYVKDMGTPERYAQVCADAKSGMIRSKSLSRPQKAVFLDRDGVLNLHRGFLRNPEDLVLLDGVPEAVRRINRSGYLAILATNQPVVARGEVTLEGLRKIHDRLETLLGQGGAYLDAIYVCPHHPDRGFPGEAAELKIDCACRKPKPGMLLKAAEDYSIDLARSWMVGDSWRDIQAGIRAGCKTALVGGGAGDFGQDDRAASLLEFTGRHLL